MECVTSLRGLVLVIDNFLEPCDDFLRFACGALAAENGVVLASADVPLHRLTWAPQSARIVDCYSSDAWGAAELGIGGAGVLMVHSVTRAVVRDGVASVLHRLLEQLQGRCLVVASVHEDCVAARDLELLKGSCNAIVCASPSTVSIVNRKAGGKVARSHQRVLDWRAGQFAAVSAATTRASAPRNPDAADSTGRAQVVLPFIKTAVSGRMMFGADDDDEDDGVDDGDGSGEGDAPDPDADLDV